MRAARVIVLLLALAVPLAACGKKAPPSPPPGEPDVYPRVYPSE
jgi:predicted small lipoprotein YifL